MQKAPLTFRLYQSVKFNRPVDKEHDNISPGGYEIMMKDKEGNIKSISFDFEDFEGNIDKDDPTIVDCMQKNQDYSCFEDLNIVDEYMLRNIESVKEWFIFTDEQEDMKEGMTPLVPVKILDPMFEIIPQDGSDFIRIPITVSITLDSNFPNVKCSR